MKAKFIASTNLACLALLTACSTNVKVHEIDEKTQIVNGIPFRIAERYKLKLYKLQDDRYEQIDVDGEKHATLPNQNHVYIMRLNGSPLSNGTVKFAINSDNTLSKVTVNSSNKGADLLSAIGTARETLSTAETQAETARIAALNAQDDVAIAELELKALPSTTSELDRLKAEQKVIKAKRTANQKARVAKIALPYPDVAI